MDARELGQHILQQFDADLNELRSKVLQTGGMVEVQLAKAVTAMTTGDSALAEEVMRADRRINEMELAVDEESALVLARRSPVASDLRLVFAVVKSITDLERMGDEAVRIARMAQASAERGANLRHLTQLRRLADQVKAMLRDALDAFARLDLELAASIFEEDQRVDREYESLTRELITFMMEDPRSIPSAIEVQWAARALERIGDRACNIAEYTVYLSRGIDIRHGGLEEFLAEVRTEDEPQNEPDGSARSTGDEQQ